MLYFPLPALKNVLLLFEVTLCFTKDQKPSIHSNLVFQRLSWVIFPLPVLHWLLLAPRPLASHFASGLHIVLRTKASHSPVVGGRRGFLSNTELHGFLSSLRSCNLRIQPHLHPISGNWPVIASIWKRQFLKLGYKMIHLEYEEFQLNTPQSSNVMTWLNPLLHKGVAFCHPCQNKQLCSENECSRGVFFFSPPSCQGLVRGTKSLFLCLWVKPARDRGLSCFKFFARCHPPLLSSGYF